MSSPRNFSFQSKGGDVFCWGRGGDGQLGVGRIEDVSLPTKLITLENKKVIKVACGGKHNIALTDTGSVYTWGWNQSHQLGLQNVSQAEEALSPSLNKHMVLISALQGKRVKDVGAGAEHSLVLLDSGLVYSWGCDSEGQLGLSDDQVSSQISSSTQNVNLYLGSRSNQARKYSSSSLSIEDYKVTRFEQRPQLLTSLHSYPIQHISCGARHSTALDENGRIWVWGKRKDGRLGLPDNSSLSLPVSPSSSSPPPNFSSTPPSTSTTSSSNPTIPSWGSYSGPSIFPKANLFYDSQDKDQKKKNKSSNIPASSSSSSIPSSSSSSSIPSSSSSSSIPSSSSSSSIPPSSSSSIPSSTTSNSTSSSNWSSNHFTSSSSISVPVVLPSLLFEFKTVTMVCCGWSHTLCIVEGGAVYSWGSGGDGRLGHGNTQDQYTPKLITSLSNQFVSQVSAGYYHSSALTDDHKVYTWGWGEYGQLGHGDTESQYEPKLLETFHEKKTEKIIKLECGGLHSLALDLRGVVWSWGLGSYGQLGHNSLENETIPKPIQSFIDNQLHVYNISCGWWHSVAIVSDSGIPVQETVDWKEQFKDFDCDSYSNSSESTDNSVTLDELSPRPRSPTFPLPMTSPIPRKDEKPLSLISKFWPSFFATSPSLQTRVPQQESMPNNKRLEDLWTQKIIPQWDKLYGSKKLKSIIREGIPPRIRTQVWPLLIQNQLGLTETHFHDLRDKFQTLDQDDPTGQSSEREWSRPPSWSSNLIKEDLPRTFPTLSLFQKNGTYYKDLLDILGSYALLRPKIGYVQGMSYLAGMLLLYFEPTQTFISFCNLLNSHFFVSLFTMDIVEIFRHVKIYEKLLRRHIPKVYRHLTNLNISPEHYLLDWFFTIFSKSMPLNTTGRVWDCFLLHGEVFLFRTSVAILSIFQNRLLQASFEECVVLLRKLPEDLDEKELFERIRLIKVPRIVHQLVSSLEDKPLPSEPADPLLSSNPNSSVSSSSPPSSRNQDTSSPRDTSNHSDQPSTEQSPIEPLTPHSISQSTSHALSFLPSSLYPTNKSSSAPIGAQEGQPILK